MGRGFGSSAFIVLDNYDTYDLQTLCLRGLSMILIMGRNHTIREFYSKRMDLAGFMCEMMKLGMMSTRMLITSVAMLTAINNGMLTSTGTVLT